MKVRIKKIIALLLIVCTILPLNSFSVTATEDSIVLVALGDSIAYGETLVNKDEERYSTLVGNAIGAEVKNYAVNGMTSDDLIFALNSTAYDEVLARADYVSISIGSNDLLTPFINILSEELANIDINEENIAAILSDMSVLTNLFAQVNAVLKDNEVLLKACDDFKSKLTTIVSILGRKAPNAKLYFNNIYNPYVNTVVKNPLNNETLIDLNSLADYYITKINKNFNTYSYDYKLIDLYTAFNKGGLTNANINSMADMSLMSVDPHPNAEGHKVIAEALLNAIGITPTSSKYPEDITGHWGESYIKAMIDKGLFTDIISSNFNPDSPMTRGMFVTVLGRLLNADVSSYTTSAFSDVSAGEYYSSYVAWASDNGIVLGSDNKFAPDTSITREEMAVIIERCINKFIITLPDESINAKQFNDADKVSSWATSAISIMQKKGLYKGDENNNVSPQDTITNAEVVTILYRFDSNRK